MDGPNLICFVHGYSVPRNQHEDVCYVEVFSHLFSGSIRASSSIAELTTNFASEPFFVPFILKGLIALEVGHIGWRWILPCARADGPQDAEGILRITDRPVIVESHKVVPPIVLQSRTGETLDQSELPLSFHKEGKRELIGGRL